MAFDGEQDVACTVIRAFSIYSLYAPWHAHSDGDVAAKDVHATQLEEDAVIIHNVWKAMSTHTVHQAN